MNEEKFQELYKKTKKEEIIKELYFKCKANYELENIIKEAREYIDNLKPLTTGETSIKEELKNAYNPKETSIKGTDEYFNAVCHLEDFEIAIWNIKDILDRENK